MKTRIPFFSSAKRRGKSFFRLWAIPILALLHACTDPDELGLGILPPSDQLQVYFTDTGSIYSDVAEGDSVLTSNILITHLLGSFSDPEFGRSDASIYAQPVFSFNPVLGDTDEILTADSLVLTLEYSTISTFASFYGNLNTPMKFMVYRMTQAMSKDSLYFSNRTFDTDPVPIGSATIVPAPGDSVLINGKNTTPHLRIRLSNTLASEILALNHTDTFASSAAWLDYFKGLYIRTEPVNGANEGSLLQMYLFGAQSAMWLYYHSDTPDDDSLRYFFPFNGVRMNHYEHTFGLSNAGKQLQDSTFNDSLHYVQGMGGIRTKLEFPNLKDLLANGHIALNKAEVIIPALYSEQYLPPSNLRILAIDSTGRSYLTADFLSEQTFYGGSYDFSNKSYTFNITRHLQAVADGRVGNYGFYLVVPFVAVTSDLFRMQPNRVIINGTSNTVRPVQLKITYTQLD